MRYLIFTFCVLITATSFGQSDSLILDLDIQVMPPKLDENLDYTIEPKLERKVIDVFTQNDIANRKESTFAVFTMLSLIEFGKLEGIATEETVQLELSFLIENVFSGQTFLVFSHKLSGSGKTKKAAINRAISSIKPQRKIYADFINKVQTKITKYYQENCETIIADAQQAIQNRAFEKAVTLLYVLPENTDCKTSNQALLDQAYSLYQVQNCQSLIQKTKVAILKKDYKDAIDLLSQVDPNSPCKEDVQELLKITAIKVDEQTAKKLIFLNKVYSDNVEIEKARQQSMKSISNTYIKGIKPEVRGER